MTKENIGILACDCNDALSTYTKQIVKAGFAIISKKKVDDHYSIITVECKSDEAEKILGGIISQTADFIHQKPSGVTH